MRVCVAANPLSKFAISWGRGTQEPALSRCIDITAGKRAGKDAIQMDSTKQRELAESLFDRNKKQETETDNPVKEEQARHAAVVRNMHRLRALRLSRKTKPR